MYAYRRFGYGIGIGPPGTLGTQLPPPEYPLQEFPGSIVRAPFAGFKSYFGEPMFGPWGFCGLPRAGSDESAMAIPKIRHERMNEISVCGETRRMGQERCRAKDFTDAFCCILA